MTSMRKTANKEALQLGALFNSNAVGSEVNTLSNSEGRFRIVKHSDEPRQWGREEAASLRGTNAK